MKKLISRFFIGIILLAQAYATSEDTNVSAVTKDWLFWFVLMAGIFSIISPVVEYIKTKKKD